jgi:glycosyltransferase involved in cell wall biosynthesis
LSIYFLTPDYAFPSGGVRVIYRHVDILNAQGISAFVLHRKQGHRCSWFAHNTPVVYWDYSLRRRAHSKLRKFFRFEQPGKVYLTGGAASVIGARDYLVLPEIYGPQEMIRMAPGTPKVILNQGCYLTFKHYPIDQTERIAPYRHPEFCGVLTNSQDGLDYLEYAFPALKIGRFHPAIDPELFVYRAIKKRQICFTTRKNQGIMQQVINILKLRNALRNFKLVPFSGIGQDEVASIFQDSAFYLSFATYEGFGLPPAEAMATGCVVIGFDGGGGKEFFRPEFSYPIETSDIVGFAATVERVLLEYDACPMAFAAKGRAAANFIRNHYAPEREKADVVDFWRGIIASGPM